MSPTRSRVPADSFADLAARAISLGIDASRTMRTAVPVDRLRSSLGDLRSPFDQVPMPSFDIFRAPGCDVPPPCWWPRAGGEVESFVCEGASATLRVEVTNCGPTPRRFEIEAPKEVTVTPGQLDLGPMERAVVTLRREGAGEAVVWVRGCYEHFVRWTVEVSSRGSSTCHEVQIEDCPDYRHHWYDHFYCERPCPASARG
jgi:hypothetical protein